jgi:hypothetical protein
MVWMHFEGILKPTSMSVTIIKTLGITTVSGIFLHQAYCTITIRGLVADSLFYLGALAIFLIITYKLESGAYKIRQSSVKIYALVLRIIFTLIAYMVMRTEYQIMHEKIEQHLITPREPILFGLDLNMALKGLGVLVPELLLKLIFGIEKTQPLYATYYNNREAI